MDVHLVDWGRRRTPRAELHGRFGTHWHLALPCPHYHALSIPPPNPSIPGRCLESANAHSKYVLVRTLTAECTWRTGRVDNSTVSTVGTPSIRCSSASTNVSRSSGRARSDCFPLPRGSRVLISYKVRGVNITGAASYMHPEVVVYQWQSPADSRNSSVIDASTPYLDVTVPETGDTFTVVDGLRGGGVLTMANTSTCITFETFQHGIGTGTWWITDIKATRLDGALINVVRTNATDINVTGPGGTPVYVRGTTPRGLQYLIFPRPCLFFMGQCRSPGVFFPQIP